MKNLDKGAYIGEDRRKEQRRKIPIGEMTYALNRTKRIAGIIVVAGKRMAMSGGITKNSSPGIPVNRL
jgi:hypothetical protein